MTMQCLKYAQVQGLCFPSGRSFRVDFFRNIWEVHDLKISDRLIGSKSCFKIRFLVLYA